MKNVPDTVNQLMIALEQAERSYHRIVLLVGPSGSGKTQVLGEAATRLGCAVLNVNLEFSQRMLDVPKNRRPKQADRVFQEIITSQPGDVVLLDNLEVLFDTALRINPLRLLQRVSRSRTIVATWNGTLHDGLLSYAEPDHAEYKSYRNVDAITVAARGQTLTM